MEKTYNKAGKKIVRRLDDPKPKQNGKQWGGKRVNSGRKSKTYDGNPKKHTSFWCRSDISKTLDTIDDKAYFIEMALLEKFERENIELQK